MSYGSPKSSSSPSSPSPEPVSCLEECDCRETYTVTFSGFEGDCAYLNGVYTLTLHAGKTCWWDFNGSHPPESDLIGIDLFCTGDQWHLSLYTTGGTVSISIWGEKPNLIHCPNLGEYEMQNLMGTPQCNMPTAVVS